MLRLRQLLILPLATCLLLLATHTVAMPTPAEASDSLSAKSSSAASSGARSTSTAPSGARPSGATAAEPRRFPNIDFGQFSDAQTQQFMRVVDGELCPCERSTLSLGECLEAGRATCGLAREVANRVYQGVARNESDAAISRGVVEHLREARTVHRFETKDAPYKGARRPIVTLVSFADYECPYCRDLARIIDELLVQYPQQLRVYFLNFPLSGHRNAMDAAIAATAAQKQDKFWEFHDLIFANQARLSQAMDAMPLFVEWARQLGMNLDTFKQDIEDHRIYDRVQSERQAAMDAGARGTPTIYLNGRRQVDIESIEVIRARIDALIQEAK